MTGHRFHPSILREYDIRGVFGETLSVDDAHAVGRSFGTVVRQRGGTRVAVGYDGRISSPVLEHALIQGLMASGVDVVRIGLGPSPMLYFAATPAAGALIPEVQGGIHVTGSHNPANHNGFKMVLEGAPFFGTDIVDLGRIADEAAWVSGPGSVTESSVTDAYVACLLGALDGIDAKILDGLRIGWDAGNGAAGPIVEALTARLGGTHVLLHTRVDGHFPNHHPDPTVEANLTDLRAAVVAHHLDFGVAFDGDGDRIGAVDSKGRVIWGDELLAIFAQDVLRDRPNATIIADVKASSTLFARIAELGGKPLMWKTGHSPIKSKMKETGAPLAGEMSGHMFFADRYFGFDDALYAAVRLIAALVRIGTSLTALRDAMPERVATPELRFQVDEARKFAAVDEVLAHLITDGVAVNQTDGVRVDRPDGWWLLRASNTQDVLVVRAESRSDEGLARLLAEVDARLAAVGLSRG
ncbi:MAG: phosphomannomutase [Novosphingobium sp. 28-62-57]|uniref:phosphoglucomutase/phosphomannomutase PgmG n=1 Tax=unclassified Novosphingobium TaxID=2644732 RepID=UPI000BCC2AC9|nr:MULTISPECIES: phosphomannomutase/phosphoglucomutase [unclassified Novosphingobium]OYW48307.1 MAG: phosphomannomutase [Novosphingobium sp. 12-62-10]OYZ11765.1 MAG: phosphomannomutase [Novosphingobium sp. 28-62-57]OZA36578.1 MAG: phosphomannomutase [Novosphingobium sp. 17-62-9]HQS69360.1 phosphomannomutase/phosphoglucomutase [Novosphingobium sp.]